MRTLAIFDFDGTLVDTITDVGLCFNEALRQCDMPQHPLESFSGFVGGDLETVVSRMLPPARRSKDMIDAVKVVYRELYLHSEKPNTKPYPGVLKLLHELKSSGFKLAVNSNKGQQLLDDLVGKIFPAGLYDAVIGYQDDKPSKPDPYGVDEICRRCGCTRSNAVYIGDGESDIATAERAGIPCIFVRWGQGNDTLANDARVFRAVADTAQLEQALRSAV